MPDPASSPSRSARPPGFNTGGLSLGDHARAQLLLLVGALLLFAWLGHNTVENMARFGITPGFSFLDRPANFEIGESLIPYSARDSYARALTVGLLNTVAVAGLGCVLATLLGTALGIARLSGNLLLSGLVQAYVEVVRNTPLLLQLFFWSATIHALPVPRQAIQPVAGVFLSNRGVFVPTLSLTPGAGWLPLTLLALLGFGLALAIATQFWPAAARRRLSRIGGSIALGAAALLAAVGVPVAVGAPHLQGFNFVGGATLSPEFATLLVGLVVNAAATICEIVRSGIEAVPPGQWEAGRAIGLARARILALIVLPQALRLIIPLTTSCYLSLTKNSSLAVAIGFPDLVSVINTGTNQTGQAIETILILIGTYLTLSLSVSLAMNAYERRLALRGGHR